MPKKRAKSTVEEPLAKLRKTNKFSNPSSTSVGKKRIQGTKRKIERERSSKRESKIFTKAAIDMSVQFATDCEIG